MAFGNYGFTVGIRVYRKSIKRTQKTRFTMSRSKLKTTGTLVQCIRIKIFGIFSFIIIFLHIFRIFFISIRVRTEQKTKEFHESEFTIIIIIIIIITIIILPPNERYLHVLYPTANDNIMLILYTRFPRVAAHVAPCVVIKNRPNTCVLYTTHNIIIMWKRRFYKAIQENKMRFFETRFAR